jgi:energy-converting hydrogenase Eha subunit C
VIEDVTVDQPCKKIYNIALVKSAMIAAVNGDYLATRWMASFFVHHGRIFDRIGNQL